MVKQFPLATLVSCFNNQHFATHIPIIFDENTNCLLGHIDKNNPQINSLVNDATVTAIFNGPSTYISPSIYSTKQLPTYNYIIAHLSGTISLINNPDELKQSLVALTNFLEGESQKFKLLQDDPRMERLVPYIQGFKINITHWEGKFKLSQDKNENDYHIAKEALIKNNNPAHKNFIENIYKDLK